jgi:hypothetical protein
VLKNVSSRLAPQVAGANTRAEAPRWRSSIGLRGASVLAKPRFSAPC